MTRIARERLGPEVLSLWRSTRLPFHPVELLWTARRCDGTLAGFAGLDPELHPCGLPIVGPLVCPRALRAGLRLLDAIERHLARAGFAGYVVLVDGDSAPGWAEQVERCGLYEPMGGGWFRRRAVVG